MVQAMYVQNPAFAASAASAFALGSKFRSGSRKQGLLALILHRRSPAGHKPTLQLGPWSLDQRELCLAAGEQQQQGSE